MKQVTLGGSEGRIGSPAPAPLKQLSGNFVPKLAAPSELVQSSDEYTIIKAEELRAEVEMRKNLILVDIIPLLLSQEHNYPKSELLLLSLIRFGASFISLELAGAKDIAKVLETALKFGDQDYQMLLAEMTQVINLT